MSKIFGEEHFIEEDMVSLVRNKIDNKIDKMVFDKMQQTIYLQLPEIKINEDKLRNWVLLCMKLENIEHSDLIDIATKKRFADLQQQLAEKDKEIEVLKKFQEQNNDLQADLRWYQMWHEKFKQQIEDLQTELETYRPTKLNGNGQCKCSVCGNMNWTDFCYRYDGKIYCDTCFAQIEKG